MSKTDLRTGVTTTTRTRTTSVWTGTPKQTGIYSDGPCLIANLTFLDMFVDWNPAIGWIKHFPRFWDASLVPKMCPKWRILSLKSVQKNPCFWGEMHGNTWKLLFRRRSAYNLDDNCVYVWAHVFFLESLQGKNPVGIDLWWTWTDFNWSGLP